MLLIASAFGGNVSATKVDGASGFKGKVSYTELQNVIVFYQFCISLFASFSTSS